MRHDDPIEIGGELLEFPNAPAQVEVWRITLESVLEDMRKARPGVAASQRQARHLNYLLYRLNSLINNLDQLEREF